MKRIGSILGGLAVLWIGFLIFCLALILTGPDISGLFDYLEKSAFLPVEATVSHVSEADGRVLFLPAEDSHFFDDMILDGTNYQTAVENGLMPETDLPVGTVVTVVAHPAYLGDGWKYPVAALSVNGMSYLDFEDGYAALLASQVFSCLFAVLFIGLGVFIMVRGVLLIRGKSSQTKTKEDAPDPFAAA